ncbi:hypothetical protein HRI_003917500 [Hibiscus trionum]|uniref:VQ domain-containing protein n=1 Tax=Hibiscus trionum TaxID=183268 RepID=A0A9W7MFR8_HIBTR|nr:hypothetical protein HRI_003917500 [Hibiscus trionum]
MDSGNSSSMQSSSGGGGDDEYDSVSRPESVPAFFNTSGHFNPLLLDHQPSSFFDPSANYLTNPFSLSPPNNSLLSFDGVRPGMSGLRSEPYTTDLGNLSNHQSILGSQGLSQGSFPSSTSMQSRPVHDNGVRTSTQSDQTTGAVKNPKKRTRASRRAPTTVLTTDTTNFRAMVQEFTGIPAPPFSDLSYSRRLDLFGSGSLYPLRPSAKRVQTPLLNNPLLAAATASTSNTTMANAFNPTSGNYQIPSDLGLLKQPQNMSNLQNQSQTLSFQSFPDLPPPLHPSLGLPGFGVKSQGSSASAMPSIDELGFHLTPEAARSRCESNWNGHGVGLNGGNQDHLRPSDGNYGNSCKLNYSASSSAFHHHDKGLENVSSRAEGTVDSWICPAE